MNFTSKRNLGEGPFEHYQWRIRSDHQRAASREHKRLAQQRQQVQQHIRGIGHDYHFVDLERGVRRNGRLIAADVKRHIDEIRTIAHQEGLSQSCLDRIEKAERVVPKMQATIEFVSGDVRQQVNQLDLTLPASFASTPGSFPRIISSVLPRLAPSVTVSRFGSSLSGFAPRCLTPGGVLSELSPGAQDQLHDEAKRLRRRVPALEFQCRGAQRLLILA